LRASRATTKKDAKDALEIAASARPRIGQLDRTGGHHYPPVSDCRGMPVGVGSRILRGVVPPVRRKVRDQDRLRIPVLDQYIQER